MMSRTIGACLGAAFTLLVQAAHAENRTEPSSQSAFFDIDGDRIFYNSLGSGTPMLLIHGFPLSHRLFAQQQKTFSVSNQVITVDLPGFGQSSTSTAKQTEVRYASELLALMKHLGINHAIVGGHSMGGQVTLEMYRQQPQIFAGMILFDTNPAAASIVEMAEWPAYGRMAEKMGSASIAPAVIGVMVTGSAAANNPVLKTILTDIVSEAMPTGVAGGGHALATRRDYTSLLGTIKVPSLVVVGLDDPVYPLPISQALAAQIPGSSLAIIPGAAHASMLQRPDAVDSAISAWLPSVQ